MALVLHQSLLLIMIYLTLITPGMTSAQETHPANGLDQYRWQNRLLIVSGPSDDTEQAEAVVKQFLQSVEELQNRKMLLLLAYEGIATKLNGSTLTVELSEEELSRYVMTSGVFQISLVGLDGQVKRTWNKPPNPAEVFEIIDSMPMRMNEIRNKKKE